MQRWILWVVLAVVGLGLLAGGGLYGLREYRKGRPAPIWVPLGLRVDISMAEQEKLAREIETRLRDEELLGKVVADLGLKEKFGVADDAAAIKELDSRIFVKVGTADTPAGSVPSINVGADGTGHDREISGEIATRIIKDVWRMIGIDPETGKPLPGAGGGKPDDF